MDNGQVTMDNFFDLAKRKEENERRETENGRGNGQVTMDNFVDLAEHEKENGRPGNWELSTENGNGARASCPPVEASDDRRGLLRSKQRNGRLITADCDSKLSHAKCAKDR